MAGNTVANLTLGEFYVEIFEAARVYGTTVTLGCDRGPTLQRVDSRRKWTGDRYRLEVRHFDGRILVIERLAERVAVVPEEAAWTWTRRYTTALQRRAEPTWSWNGPEIPSHKGFFDFVVGDPGGRVWVSRAGPGIRTESCDEDPEPASSIARCWQSAVVLDVFGPDGRFLGDVDVPPGFGVFGPRRAYYAPGHGGPSFLVCAGSSWRYHGGSSGRSL